jgi:hypothetical protein
MNCFMIEESPDSVCLVSPLQSVLRKAVQLSRLLGAIPVCVLLICLLTLEITYISVLLTAIIIYTFSGQEV